MRRTLSAGILAAAIGILAAPGRSAAQPPGPLPVGPVAQPPRFSSYLNLTRGTGNAAVNYYGIIRPQLQVANQVMALQQNQANPFTPAGAAAADQPVVTGNPVGFQNYRLYFQNQFSGGGIAPNFGPGTLPAGAKWR